MGTEPEDRQSDLTVKVDIRRNLRNLYAIAKPYRWRFLTLMLIILVLEASYVLDKYFFKLVVDDSTAYTTGTLGQQPFVDALLTLAVLYTITLVVRSVLKFLHIHFVNWIDTDLIFDLKVRFFTHLIRLDHNFHTTNKTGSMISRLSRGGRAIEALIDVIVFNFAPMAFLFVIAAAALWQVSANVTLVLTAMIVAFVGYGVIIQRLQLRQNVIANRDDDIEKARVGDYFTNIESIKYYGKEDDITRRYTGFAETTKRAFYKMWGYFRWMDAGHSLILSVSALAIIALSVRSLLAGEATVGELAFIYTVYTTLLGPLFGFMHGIREFARSMADFESLYEYERFENAIKEHPGAKPLRVTDGRISFDQLTFKYHKKRLFENFTLEIEPNKKVALVGHSGSGKSTLVKLLYRLYDVHGGAVRIDGQDVREVQQESLRSALSIVPQEAVLFDDTIWNNIRFSNPSASNEQVRAAIRFAQLDGVIAAMPQQEHTIVGERGVKLSGGEKQRVSIARALLADKKILVLDEATSALDSKTEHEIQQDLERLMEGRTSIIIAHRLSTIMHSDTIVVLDKGAIVQMGTHAELIKQEGVYKHLWNLQKGGYIK